MIVTVAELDRDPLVPVKVSLYVPAGPQPAQAETVDAEPLDGTDRVIELSPNANQQPTALAEGDWVSVTLPEKPFTLVTVIVVCCSDPSVMLRDDGLADRLKLGVLASGTTWAVAGEYCAGPA